jgi:hypothetical protein
MANDTIHVRGEEGLKGFIRRGGCQHPKCKRAMREGREFHAIPAAFAVTLPDYHFATIDDAEAALSALPARDAA